MVRHSPGPRAGSHPGGASRRARSLVALATAVVVPFAALPAAAAAVHTPASSATSLSALGLTAEQVAAASVEGAATLRSAQLDVQVAADFPRVLSYTDRASGASLAGSTATVTKVRLNGTDRAVAVEAGEPGETSRDYRLTFPDLAGVSIDTRLEVEGSAVTFRVTGVTDTEAFRVGTIEVPGHDLLSVSSADPSAVVASAVISPDRGKVGDTFTSVTGQTPVNANPVGSAYAIVSTSALSATIVTNSVYDEANGKAAADGNRLQRQARAADGGVRVGVWSGAWTYRAQGSPVTEELPYATVVVTADANADDKVDWQDGAIAFRATAPKALGADQVADRVVTHIPFNFASQATHPFLRTLDDVKRISLATDGLGQMALLKGYGSEGHDSAHPDYGGNYNERAGGLEDMNTLLAQGGDWNADFGVHINATEAYAEANAFSDELVDPSAKGWNWLGQSYYIDQRRDVNSGDLAARIGQLADETQGNLDLLYVDVYYNFGWQARALADAARANDLQIATEWSDKFEANSLWSHWSADENYGGAANKGLNSQIVRFIDNAEKDTWNPHPLLGNARLVEFEGWTGQTDWNAFYKNIWTTNVPTKFLQHQEIVRWGTDRIDFRGDVSARGTTAADRQILVGDAVVAQGGTYLLPWNASDAPGLEGEAAEGSKLYHYNPAGGSTTWTLTDELAGATSLTMYKLTTTGREKVADVPVTGGKVTVDATAGQPYVLYPQGVATPSAEDVAWGAASGIVDPGFNAATLDAYETTGTTGIETLANGQRVATLGAGASSLSQQLGELSTGTYAVSAWVEVQPGKSRSTTLSVSGEGVAQNASTVVERSTAKNLVAADEKNNRYYQRVQVLVDVTGPARPTLTVSASAGDAVVRVDDLRVVSATRSVAPAVEGETGTVVAFEDFENVPQGWGPFVKGDAGGVTDPRTHIAQRNAPYTQAGWNGKLVDDALSGDWSLKAHEENKGLVYRTVPSTVKLEAGRQYRVSFDYQSGNGGEYQWVTGYDSVASGAPASVETHAAPLGQQRTTATFSEDVVASGCGDTWVGLRKLTAGGNQSDLILDDFRVVDLGPAEATPACASLTVSPGPVAFEPDVASTVTTRLTVHEPVAVADVAVTLDVPEGWEVEATNASTAATLPAGGVLTTTWQVTPHGKITADAYTLTSGGSYTTTAAPVGERSVEAGQSVWVVVPPNGGENWVSDLPFVSTTNGWGPVERDLSNGEQGEKDGKPLSLRGVVHEKGLGTHANSSVRVFLAAQCDAFTATVGVDDVQGTKGTVQFKVVGDGTQLAQTEVLKGGGKTVDLDVPVTGVRYLDLIVTDGGDGNGNDHADWGSAKVSCADPVEPEPELEVTTTAKAQCAASRVQLAVRAVNEEDFPVDVKISTPFGTKTFQQVQPGKSASQTFTTRKDAIEAGTATVTATATVDGKEVTTTIESEYAATSCG
ncbi:endo-alpha-N-acetylgalactosaminidase family protein [Oerskovia sp. Root22]|uniref:endo-alpha-N-acetylgalactosaminidase family protein n=1 Tax=Oerskovia sp. Root22 TaxID=1736494 RepID=UPI0009EA3589|nr:endo-alpha-N-acetylgalactosaminidase family protein [Oerskovia sp. Root22]